MEDGHAFALLGPKHKALNLSVNCTEAHLEVRKASPLELGGQISEATLQQAECIGKIIKPIISCIHLPSFVKTDISFSAGVHQIACTGANGD